MARQAGEDHGKTIRLMTPLVQAAPTNNAPRECAIKRVSSAEAIEVRSQSRVSRAGLNPQVPREPLFLCLGDIHEAGVNRFKNECSCDGFERLEIPLSETLKPQP